MHKKTSLIGLLLFTLLPWGSSLCETITSAEYLPLADGNSWIFRFNDASTGTFTVLPGVTTINGTPTKALKFSNGGIQYYTSDSNGIRLHGEFDAEDSLSLTYIPPLVWVRGTANIPETLNSAGTVIVDSPGSWSGSLNYTYTSNLEARDTVTVPADTYNNTIRLSDMVHIFGNIDGSEFDYSSSSTFWLAKYIGQVKEIFNDVDGTETLVLTSTNVQPPPDAKEPTQFLPFLPLLLE